MRNGYDNNDNDGNDNGYNKDLETKESPETKVVEKTATGEVQARVPPIDTSTCFYGRYEPNDG